MELPITLHTLRTMVATAKEQREKEFRECVLGDLLKPEDVLVELQKKITESVFKQDKLECFRVKAATFPYIYRRFGEPNQIQKEIWSVLADYVKNFPSANLILETVENGVDGTPVSCRLYLCFNLPWTPPTSDQTSSRQPQA
jgi:hypothetical protein